MESTRHTNAHSTSTRYKPAGTYYYGEEDNLFRSQGPDGGFHTGYDQTGTYPGTQENAETTSMANIGISSLSTTSPFALPFFSISSWIIFLYTGHGVAALPLSSRSSFGTKETQKQSFRISSFRLSRGRSTPLLVPSKPRRWATNLVGVLCSAR